MHLDYIFDREYRVYMVRGHVDMEAFRKALAETVSKNDSILTETPEHCWLRLSRDRHQRLVVVKAEPESRGAFKATLVRTMR